MTAEFSFETKQNVGSRAVIPVYRDFPTGSILCAEFDPSGTFQTPVLAGVVDFYQGSFVLQLTPWEVNLVRSSYFRIVAKFSKGKMYPATGRVAFHPVEVPMIKDGNQVLTSQQLSTVAMTGNYADLLNKPDSAGVTVQDLANAVQIHRREVNPHPVYDDLPSLNLLFENGLM